jgi:hypothetical protein
MSRTRIREAAFSFRLSQKEEDWLVAEADRRNRSKAEVLRDLIAEAMSKHPPEPVSVEEAMDRR